ncbi:hypothetical protein FRC03_001776 [Tulasnella sp. 419]|nr:hypothetical protein FRC03_001776 [Tulasnella sp. 419]
MKKEQSRKWRAFRSLTFSRRGIAIAKGLIAYILAFVLIFLKDFDDLSKAPQTLVSMMLIVIAGGPGKAIGAVIGGNLLGVLGLMVGAFNYFILSKLSPWPVAQAVYWAFAVYLLAYVKAKGFKWFGFSLFAILTLFIFPISSERELRSTLVRSLEHIDTFGMLISKSFLMIITEEEKATRDQLAQTIRADYGFLNQKLAETTLEINWSRWSLDDYRAFINKTRALQLALISTHSSLSSLEDVDDEIYRNTFIPKTLGPFNKVRLDMRLTIREIASAFGCHPLDQLPKCAWSSYLDIERQAAELENPTRMARSNSYSSAVDDAERAAQLREVSERLAAEFSNDTEEESPEDPDSPTTRTISAASSPKIGTGNQAMSQSKPDSTFVNTPVSGTRDDDTEKDEKAIKEKILTERGPKSLLEDFAKFRRVQFELISKALTGGRLTNCSSTVQLHVNAPQPSIAEQYGYDHVRGRVIREYEEAKRESEIRKRKSRPISTSIDQPSGSPLRQESHDSDSDGDDVSSRALDPERMQAVANNHSLVRVYSILFAITQYVDELHEFHQRVMATDSKGRQARHRIHFHFFESLNKTQPPPGTVAANEEKDLSLGEAMAVLESRPHQKEKRSIWHYVHDIKVFLLGSDSVYAAKTSAAATIYSILLLADTTRQWFISYSMTGGLLTVVVALAPTLGQSALTFILQIAGSALGYLIGLALLEMFRNVGGYVFNPYGIVCLVALYAIPLQYLIYEQPKFFALALLALNATGVLIGTEWLYVVHLGRSNFDSPAYRTGKGLTSLAVAIALCATFQLLVARNPARRQLRKALAHITYLNLAYITLLQAFVRAVVPADPSHTVPDRAVETVRKELQRREVKLQRELIEIMPLITFASAEPSLSHKFNPVPPLRIIRANQAILDRLREARAAIGTTPFEEHILTNFVSVLSPYRRRAHRSTKTTLSLCAASLSSKLPLPHDLPRAETASIIPDFIHDALVLSHRFAMTPEGQRSIHENGEFLRYWQVNSLRSKTKGF